MKSLRYIILCAAALAACQNLGAWGSTGHKIVAELALRQLGTGASARISALFPDGLAEEASWADQHRHDEEYAFTDSYHTMAMNHDYAYDPIGNRTSATAARRLQSKKCVPPRWPIRLGRPSTVRGMSITTITRSAFRAPSRRSSRWLPSSKRPPMPRLPRSRKNSQRFSNT